MTVQPESTPDRAGREGQSKTTVQYADPVLSQATLEQMLDAVRRLAAKNGRTVAFYIHPVDQMIFGPQGSWVNWRRPTIAGAKP